MHKLIILFVLFSFSICEAAPAIDSISGTVEDGQPIVISSTGTNFTTKATAAPIRWDDYDNYTTGQSLATATSWWVDVDRTNKIVISIDNQRTGSSKNLYAHSDYTDGMSTSYKNSIGFSTTGKILISLWMRFDWGVADPDLDTIHQIKTWRIPSDTESNGNVVYPDFAHFSHSQVASDQTYFQNHRGSDSNSQYFTHDYITDNTWFQMTLEVDMGTAGVADGNWKAWLGKIGSTFSTIVQSNVEVMNSGEDDIDSFKFDNYIGNCDDGGGPTECVSPDTEVNIYYDDIYIDNVWNRVEIGNNSVYANCTQREIQIPTAWSTSEITVTVNQGAFSNGIAYLFVIDSNGDISDAEELTFVAAEESTLTTINTTGTTGVNPTGTTTISAE